MRVHPRRYFPWKIVRHYVVSHIVFLIGTLVVTGFSIRYFVYNTFINAADLHAAVGALERFLTGLFWVVLLVGVAAIVVSARYYLRPLGRLIQRARELRRPDAQSRDYSDEDYEAEDPGEWFDLERALNRIHRDLRQQTEALEREREELSALISAVSDAILAVDTHGDPLFFNSQFALLFGNQGGQQKAWRLGEIFRAPDVLTAFRETLTKGETRQVSTSIHTTRHAVPRHFSISVAPLKNKEDGAVYGAVGSFHDVTELKKAEQIRIEFVGNASHELRTPLTSIKGYVDTLKGDFKNGQLDGAEKFLEIISRNVDRLNYLVNDLLDLSTIESGAELQKEKVSTREVTESVLRQLEGRRAAKGIQVATKYGAEDLSADPQRVEQVLVNLVYNAIKYIPENRKIEIIWEDGAGHKDHAVTLRVRDNGPGIPPEHHSRLFERFYRLDTGRTRDAGGTGLGLSIVKHIMIKHGGSVQLKSQLGQGAEFVCHFPG